jgi:hypothetical protein
MGDCERATVANMDESMRVDDFDGFLYERANTGKVKRSRIVSQMPGVRHSNEEMRSANSIIDSSEREQSLTTLSRDKQTSISEDLKRAQRDSSSASFSDGGQ